MEINDNNLNWWNKNFNEKKSINQVKYKQKMKIWISLFFVFLLLVVIFMVHFLMSNTNDNHDHDSLQEFNANDNQSDYEALQEEIILTKDNNYIGNDASFYCIEKWNSLVIKVDKNGNSYWVCVLPDWTEVNAFDYYNSNNLKKGDDLEKKWEEELSGNTYNKVNYKNIIKGWEIKKRVDLNWNEFEYWEIQAWDITIMDRNLWAINNDISSTWSYGYYYQWWNNYGFIWDFKTSGIYYKSVDTNGYWPWKPYFNDTFLYNTSDRSSEQNNNLWWWEWDNLLNKFWLDIENRWDRQWPCPSWWHVPSIWEWNKLLQEWALNHWKLDLVDLSSLYYLSDNSYEDFLLDFNIPLAGTHHKDWEWFFGQGKNWTYHSSTPCTFSIYYVCWNKWSHSLHIVSSDEEIDTGEWYARAYGNSIRCFKNK